MDPLSAIEKLLRRAVVNAVAGIALMVLFLATWLAIAVPLVGHQEDASRRPVRNDVPGDFPYLVLVPAPDGRLDPHVILHADLPEFLAQNPGHTFLVPGDREAELRREVASRNGSGPEAGGAGRDYFLTSFEVERRGPVRQRLAVTARLDDDDQNVGWYDATDREVFPAYHQAYFGPGVALDAVGDALLYNLILWAGAAGALWFLRRPRVRRLAPASPR